VASLVGHDAFVYSIDYDPGTQRLVTASEDGTARVWTRLVRSDGGGDGAPEYAVAAVLPHPTTVWAACFLANGDVATACADGVARVFTTDAARAAAGDAVSVYRACLNEAEQKALEAKRQKLGACLSTLEYAGF
jgi:phospholipase A-2-activating protein